MLKISDRNNKKMAEKEVRRPICNKGKFSSSKYNLGKNKEKKPRGRPSMMPTNGMIRMTIASEEENKAARRLATLKEARTA